MVWEIPYYPTYYFPASDVRADLFTDSGETKRSPSRGTAALHDITVGDRTAHMAALVWNEAKLDEVEGYVSFDWASMDQWFEEDEEVYTHARDPYTRIDALHSSREIRIDAHIFELDLNRLKEIGTNYAAVFSQQGGQGGQGGGGAQGGAGGQSQQGLGGLAVNTESIFDSIEDIIEGPNRVTFSELLSLFRWFESEGAGETIASPSVTVQSGEKGRIQIGSDIPVTLQDFAGNTVTQYIATGVIIDVTPTLISDASDSRADPEIPPVEFIHLDVNIEKSSGSPSAAGITIDKNTTDTQVLLLDGEQTVIGGLFSTEESVFRRGVPILKDIPLIKYLFSYETKTVTQKELLIVLQARVMDPLRVRAGRPFPTNLYERERQDVQQRLNRFKPGAADDMSLIDPEDLD